MSALKPKIWTGEGHCSEINWTSTQRNYSRAWTISGASAETADAVGCCWGSSKNISSGNSKSSVCAGADLACWSCDEGIVICEALGTATKINDNRDFTANLNESRLSHPLRQFYILIRDYWKIFFLLTKDTLHSFLHQLHVAGQVNYEIVPENSRIGKKNIKTKNEYRSGDVKSEKFFSNRIFSYTSVVVLQWVSLCTAKVR